MVVATPLARRTPTDSVILTIAVASICLAVFQLSLGASAMLVLALLGTTAVSLVPVRLYRLSHLVGAFYFVLCLYFGFNALLVPTLALRPADAGLFTPDFSALVVLVFACAASAAAMVPRFFFPNLRTFVRPVVSAVLLRQLALVMLGLGLVGTALTQTEGLRSIGQLLNAYPILAFILAIAATLVGSGNRRSMSALGLLIVAILILNSFLFNSKMPLFVAVGCWVLTNLAFGRRMGWRMIAVVAVVGMVITYLFFAINMVRSVRDQVGSTELIVMTVETAVGLATGDPQAVAAREQLYANVNDVNLLEYSILYFDGLPVLVERFVMLPYADAILRAVPPDGPYAGAGVITDQFANLLPAFLNPGKQSYYLGNVIVIMLGLGGDDFAAHPTMGLAPELFFAGGYGLVVFGTFVLFAIASTVLAAAGGSMIRNAFAIFLFVRYIHLLVAGTSMSFLFLLGRQLPLDIFVFLVAAWFFTRGGEAGKPRAVHAAPQVPA